MIIKLQSVGGFTGPAGKDERSIDVDTLQPEDARRLKELAAPLLQTSHHGPQVYKKASPQSWDFLHTLTIQDGGTSTSVQFHEDAAPPQVKALFDEVGRVASRP